MKSEGRLWRLSCLVLAALLGGQSAHAAQPWHHGLSYPRGGYWRGRLPVDVRNTSERDFEGEPVRLRVDKLGLAGQPAEAMRVVDSKGRELLFDVRNADGGSARAGELAGSDTLFLRIDCTKGQTARVWVYADNAAAMPVPDFLKPCFVNGGFEAGRAAPDGWTPWGNDDTHAVSWVAENPHSGKYCGKVSAQPGAKPTWVKWMQRNIPLRPGAKYRIRAWVKSDGVKGRVGWFIHVNGERPQMINRSLRIDPAPGGWQEVDTQFVCPQGANDLTIGTLLHGTGVAFFDDASLEALTEAASLEVIVGKQEALELAELTAPAKWQLRSSDWRCRTPVRTMNTSNEPMRNVVVRAALTRAIVLAQRYGPVTALRVIGPEGKLLPHVSMRDPRRVLEQAVGGGQVASEVSAGDSVLFVADIPARSVCDFHVYFSSAKDVSAGETMAITSLIRSKANLVRNADFEAGGDELPNWPTSTERERKRTFNFRVAAGGVVGDRCIEMTVPPTAALRWSGWRQFQVPVNPGASYLLAGYLKTKRVTDGSARLHGHWMTKESKLATSPFFSVGKGQSGDTDWTLNLGAVRAPADAATVEIHLTMNARGTTYHDGILFCEIANAESGQFQPGRPAATSGRGYDVWEVNPIVKVFPDDPPGEPAQHVRIAAARNEREVFQLVVRPNRRLDQLDVKCTPLVGPSGAALPAVEVERVAFVPIDNRSSYFRSDLPEYYRKLPNNAGRTDGWVGEWPDPVPPFSKMDLPSGRNLPLWLTVHVPADAKPGEYRGSLTLTPANAAATNLPISVTVWDFALPKVSHLKVIYDLRGGPRGGVFGGADPKARLRTWYRFLAERRVSPGLLYPHPKLTFKDGKVSMDFTDFDEMARYCFDELGINVIYTPWYFYAFGWAYKPRKFAGFEAFTPEYEKAFTDAYRLFMAHLKEKGWYDKVVYYISDEPHFRHDFVVEQMKKMCDLAHRADPNVPIYSSTWRHVPQWNGYLDIWGVGQYGCFPVEEMDRRIADGEKLWFTTDGQMATDTPYCGTERLLPYYCLKYGVEGYEFWGVSWWTYDPWKYGWHTFKRQSSDGKEYRWVRYPNGDGYLAYPGDAIGREEPVSTIRLDQAREGVEDYEYFVILRDLIAHAKTARLSTAEADAALESVKALVSIPNPGGYRSTDIMPDPDAIPKVRRAVAEQILRLNKAVRKR